MMTPHVALTRLRTQTIARMCALVVSALLMLVAAAVPSGQFSGQAGAAEPTGTLTVIKHEGEGELESISNPQPMEGVLFQVNRLVGLQAQSQQELGELARKEPWLLTSDPGYEMDLAVRATTDVEGKAVFTDLPYGVYVVQEIPDYSNDAQNSVVPPFLIAVPDASGNPDVLVYAKNQQLLVNKIAEVTETEAGSLVTWRVRSQVPAPDVRGKLYQFIVRDTLDEHLDLAGAPIVTIARPDLARRLNEPEDYTYTYDAATRRFELTMTEAGLAKLAEMRNGHPDTVIDIALPTRVKADTPDDTRIVNVAHIYPEGYDPNEVGGFATGGIESRVAGVWIRRGTPVPDPTDPWPPVNWPDLDPIEGPDIRLCPTCEPCPDCQSAPTEQNRPGTIDRIINRVTGHDPNDASQANKPLRDRLASTGANVIWLFIGALILVGLGVWLLIWRRRKKDEEPASETTETGEQR